MREKITRDKRQLHFETQQIHAGQEKTDTDTGSRAVPIYQTAAYVFNDSADAQARFALQAEGNIYTRLTNPTWSVFEQRMAVLEGGIAALSLASGQAAVTYAIQAITNTGDHIISANNIYGGTSNLMRHTLPTFGITTTFVDIFDEQAIRNAVQDNTKLVFIESLGNPHSEVVDIEKIAKIAHEYQLPLIVDNTFGTPYLVRPIEFGADIVVHSATKFIGGHGTSVGGVIVDSGKFDWEGAGRFSTLVDPQPGYHGLSFTKAVGPLAYIIKLRAVLLRDLGACISPFNAWMFLQGLETLSLRVERHMDNALKVVDFLSKHENVAIVRHPSRAEDKTQQELYQKYFPNGGGSIFTFEVKGGLEETMKFIDNLELFSNLANVADAKSLVSHPFTTTHSQCTKEELTKQNIKENTVRLSVGIEHIDDIIQDLDEALLSINN